MKKNMEKYKMFNIIKAKRSKINLLLAVCGASGAGKTYTSLLLANSLAKNTGKIALIDTENGRSLHYAPKEEGKENISEGIFDFLWIDFPPPYTPKRYIEAIEVAIQANVDVIIIDSISHEYAGEGGILEMADDKAIKNATDDKGVFDQKRYNASKISSWLDPKKEHKKLMLKLLNLKIPVIFCLRAEDKLTINKENNKTVYSNSGYKSICEKSFMFEMTASIMLNPNSPGKTNHALDNKLSNEFKLIFPNNKIIDTQSAEMLAKWTGLNKENNKMTIEQGKKWLDWLVKATSNEIKEKVTKQHRESFSSLKEIDENLALSIQQELLKKATPD